MKKLLTAIRLVLAVLASAGTATAQNTPVSLLPGVTTTTTGSAFSFANSAGAQVHFYSAAGSSASVVLSGGMTSTGPWHTLATVINPSAIGECYEGVAWPYLRAVDTHSSGTVTVKARSLPTSPGAWAPCVATASSSTTTRGFLKYSWTNAQIVAGGTGGTSYNLPIGTLPAKSRVVATYLTVDTQATFAAGTLTGSVGVAGTAYADWIVASDLKASAATVYGDAAAERGATNIDGQLYYSTAKSIYMQVLAGAGDLANVTTSTGTIVVEYVTYP